jgi:hypothetical protein
MKQRHLKQSTFNQSQKEEDFDPNQKLVRVRKSLKTQFIESIKNLYSITSRNANRIGKGASVFVKRRRSFIAGCCLILAVFIGVIAGGFTTAAGIYTSTITYQLYTAKCPYVLDRECNDRGV